MRPINRGNKPDIKISAYRNYYPSLKAAIGNFCSYCERPLPDSELHIEHIRPKHPNEEYKLCWNNLLLACFTCNSHKDKCDKNIRNVSDLNFDKYAFPHIYDTYHLIDYPAPTYMPQYSQQGNSNYQPKVKQLLQLLQLRNDANLSEEELLIENEIPKYRIYAGQEAAELKKDLGTDYNEEQVEAAKKKIKREIEKSGFWSIWMKAFEDVEEIKNYLLDLLPGTEKRYFENNPEIRHQCEHEHIYNDIVGTLEHRLNYVKQNGQVPHSEDWNNSIEAEIEKRLPNMTNEEKEQIQKYVDEIKSN